MRAWTLAHAVAEKKMGSAKVPVFFQCANRSRLDPGTCGLTVRRSHDVAQLRKAIDERIVVKRSPVGVGEGLALDERGTTLSRPVRPDGAFALRGFVDSPAFGTEKSSFEIGFRPVLRADGKVWWNGGVLTEPLIWRSPGTVPFPYTCKQKAASLDGLCSRTAPCF